MKLHCSRCQNPRRKSGRFCLTCHAENMREWRRTHPLNPDQRKKDNCRSYAGVYKRRGKLAQKPCDQCGASDSQMHHDDYSKPLQVSWKCRGCHLELHKELAMS